MNNASTPKRRPRRAHTKARQLWEAIKANPGGHSTDLAAALGWPIKNVAAGIAHLAAQGDIRAVGVTRNRAGRLSRTYEASGDVYGVPVAVTRDTPARDDDPVHPQVDDAEPQDTSLFTPPAHPSAAPRDDRLREAGDLLAKAATVLIERFLERAVSSAVADAIPQLERRIISAITELSASMAPARSSPKAIPHEDLPPMPSERAAAAAGISWRMEAAERVKPHQVAIVNALPAQFESVKRAFPTMDVRLFEEQMPALTNPSLVISLTKFMSHSLDRKLRKTYGERYCPVNGAADSIKRAITARLHIHAAQAAI